jgi:hypothetical protein
MAKEWAQVAGGLLQGLGTGMVENGRAAREARLAELEHGRRKELIGIEHGNAMARQDDQQQFTVGENTADRAFRAGEARKDRGFRAGESAADRAFRSSEAEKEREARRGLLSNRETVVGDDGNLYTYGPDNKAVPVTDAQGNPLKPAAESGTADLPADARMIEYLTQSGDMTRDEAIDFIRTGRADPTARLRIASSIYKSMKADMSSRRTDDGELWRMAQQRAGISVPDAPPPPPEKKDEAGWFDKAVNLVTGGDASAQEGAERPQDGARGKKPPADYPDARKAPDGNWYVERDGKFYRVVEE